MLIGIYSGASPFILQLEEHYKDELKSLKESLETVAKEKDDQAQLLEQKNESIMKTEENWKEKFQKVLLN